MYNLTLNGMQGENEKIIFNLIELLKQERIKAGLSHEKLSQKAGIHRTTIGHIEAHQMVPTIAVCLKIAAALNINFCRLLTKAIKISA